jgi:CRP-like cAMP-binding protein
MDDGEVVYEAGSMPLGIYFVFAGLAAEVAVPTSAGGIQNVAARVGGLVGKEFESTPYYFMGRQNYFGEYEVIFPHPRSGGVRAVRSLTAYLLPRNNFVDIVNEVPELLEHFRRKAIRRHARRDYRLRNHTLDANKLQRPAVAEDTAAAYMQRAYRVKLAARARRRKVGRAIRKTLTSSRMKLTMARMRFAAEEDEPFSAPPALGSPEPFGETPALASPAPATETTVGTEASEGDSFSSGTLPREQPPTKKDMLAFLQPRDSNDSSAGGQDDASATIFKPHRQGPGEFKSTILNF